MRYSLSGSILGRRGGLIEPRHASGQISEHSRSFPERSVSYDVANFLGARYGDVEQVRPSAGPIPRRRLSWLGGSENHQDRFRFSSGHRMDRADAVGQILKPAPLSPRERMLPSRGSDTGCAIASGFDLRCEQAC